MENSSSTGTTSNNRPTVKTKRKRKIFMSSDDSLKKSSKITKNHKKTKNYMKASSIQLLKLQRGKIKSINSKKNLQNTETSYSNVKSTNDDKFNNSNNIILENKTCSTSSNSGINNKFGNDSNISVDSSNSNNVTNTTNNGIKNYLRSSDHNKNDGVAADINDHIIDTTASNNKSTTETIATKCIAIKATANNSNITETTNIINNKNTETTVPTNNTNSKSTISTKNYRKNLINSVSTHNDNKYYNRYHKIYNFKSTPIPTILRIVTPNPSNHKSIVGITSINTNKYYNANHSHGHRDNKNNKINITNLDEVKSLLSNTLQAMSIGPYAISSEYKAKVLDAFVNRRIFTIYGRYSVLREALQGRGWLEKLEPRRYAKLQTMPDYSLVRQAKPGNSYEIALTSKIIKNCPAFFIWHRNKLHDINLEKVLPLRNCVHRSGNLNFCTKVGLIGCAEVEKWYKIDGLSEIKYPRSYRLSDSTNESDCFIEDYRRTQCRSLVRLAVEHKEELKSLANVEEGTVNPAILQFAVMQLQCELKENDSNSVHSGVFAIDNSEWTDFLQDSSLILSRRTKFKATPKVVADYVKLGYKFLSELEEMHADYKWDGCRNLWILKPGSRSCGIGILLKHALKDILRFTTNNQGSKYIAQKYIERPLLMYNAKFDIRQYMLLVFGKTLISIWFYKDCYFRISSQVYDMNDLGEAIHLTNHTVAKRYKISASRDKRLPHNNMCSLETFKAYLKSTNAPENVWGKKIFPAFKRSIIAVILASIEGTSLVENCFELYGCDFMLDANYDPVLIEINSTPDMSPSTAVTARLCPLVLNDVVRVIVDLPQNPKASTGNFELIFQIPYTIQSNFDPKVGMPVEGKAIILHNREPIAQSVKPTAKFIKNNATSVGNTSSSGMSASGKDIDLHGPKPIVQLIRPAAKCCTEDNKSVALVDPGPSIPNTPSSEGIQTVQPVQLRPIQPERPIRRFYVKRFLRKLITKL